MTERMLGRVLEIERSSFPTPWPRDHFLFELRGHRYAHNVVLERAGEVLGYACLWFVYDEVRINNIAIHPARRGLGLGSWLLRWILREAAARGCREATLEVRPSNGAALRLYRSHGFREVGRRKGYYSDTREDAIVMSAPVDPGHGDVP
jgi:ribosomal-protein-alanine N-acetyltransferase